MPTFPFYNLAGVTVIAFLCPLALGLVPALRIPAAALEIVVGIAVGPSGFNWVRPDTPVDVMYIIGLGFLLFLSGLEIDFYHLRRKPLMYSIGGFVFSFLLAFAIAYLLQSLGIIKDLPSTPLLVAIILSATSLGMVVPVLKDSGHHATAFGQLVITASSVAEIAPIILLSLFFSAHADDSGSKILLLISLIVLGVATTVVMWRAEDIPVLDAAMTRLQDTTAQIRVRGAFALLICFIAVVNRFDIEDILGAFTAGAALKIGDRTGVMFEHSMGLRLDAIGFGVFIPVFFVTSGLTFDLQALFSQGTLIKVPIFLVAILLVRGIPALLYRPVTGLRGAIAAGLLQSTTLSFVVVATQLGLELGLIRQSTASALLAAALIGVLLFPLGALLVLRAEEAVKEDARTEEAAAAT